MYQLTELPKVKILVIDASFNDLSFLEKLSKFWKTTGDYKKTLIVPLPVNIIDTEETLHINTNYEYVEAYFDFEVEKTGEIQKVYYKLYNVHPYAIMNGNKLCDVEKLEIDIDRF